MLPTASPLTRSMTVIEPSLIPGKLSRRVLDESEPLIFRDSNVMRPFGCRNRFKQFRLPRMFADVENIQMPRLCGAHIQPIGLAVEVDFERNARLHRRKIEHLCNIKILFLWIPSCGPQCSTEHIGDIGDRRISTWNKRISTGASPAGDAFSIPYAMQARYRCWPRPP